MADDADAPTPHRSSGVLLCAPAPLVHASEFDDGEVLRREATDHLARCAALQVVAEIWIVLRGAHVPWWSPAVLRERWSVGERLRWLAQRPERRDEIVGSLTGLAIRHGRRRSVEFQVELIEAVADPALDAQRIEDLFDPRDLVVYGPAREIWDEMIQRIPWDTEVAPALVERLLSILLADRSTILGTTRPPILTPWQLRTALDGRAWQAHLPARLRAAVDEARLHKELLHPREPFTARDELAIITAGVLATSFPLRALRPAFTSAARVMGFEHTAPAHSQPAPLASFAEVANDADIEDTVSTA